MGCLSGVITALVRGREGCVRVMMCVPWGLGALLWRRRVIFEATAERLGCGLALSRAIGDPDFKTAPQ